MKDEQINIAIAEACGWEDVSDSGFSGLNLGIPPASENLTTTRNWECVNGVGYYEIKDYSQDLNAMHEAEKVLTEQPQLLCYYGKLVSIVRRERGIDEFEQHYQCLFTTHATARERAEAFLRTIGKWEESES